MPEDLVSGIINKVFSAGGLPAVLLLGAVFWLAWQRTLDRKARIEADQLDREFAQNMTRAMTAVSVALARIEGFISGQGHK